jgi:acyl transferase domain-containing protein/acyl carrier protein/NAD(P)-dependent dehydrogenase (short-subunit alcohol dehydrogenase family)
MLFACLASVEDNDLPDSLIQQPLAIVGMACRLPNVDSLEGYWQILLEGRSAIGPLTKKVLDRDLHYDPQPGVRGKTYSIIGGLVPDHYPDLTLLGLDAKSANDWDECHLIFAEVAARAWRHAGYSNHDPKHRSVGVYIGHSGGSRRAGELIYATMAEQTVDLLNDLPDFIRLPSRQQTAIRQAMVERMQVGRPQREAGGRPHLEASAAARLVAKCLGFAGPQLVLDAACASSLVALGLAAMDLQAGTIESAIVGGAAYNKVDSLILFSQARSCSPTASRPFDERADGLIASEGYIALVIKTLERALDDGDAIWGVLGGLGIATDGRGKSLWAPRREGQYLAMQRAYDGLVKPERVQYVEAHATSTQVGDATEAQALADFFRRTHSPRSLPIGSVKSNIGHTLETAGLAGLLKTVLGMHHGLIPPTINLEQPSASIDWNHAPFHVPTQVIPWPTPLDGLPRCGAVNAFGIGGLNVHVVVEQYAAAYHHELIQQRSKAATSPLPFAHEPIAIVGTGVIVPGAQSLNQLQAVVDSPTSKLVAPPEQRWRKAIGVQSSATASGSDRRMSEFCPSTANGGYLLDYAYDWKKHKVPPKQVQRANPLQFMLLDAASQSLAITESPLSPEPQPRTSVVVGTIFGGEFGHQLQLGLRLCELQADLQAVLRAQALDKRQAESLVAAFAERVLEVNPALLDETGSFTSSTLASRITKQFNLMGGAMAIDAGDASGEAALAIACGLLRAGTSDAVLCAAGQRAMDLPSYQIWMSRNQLSDDPRDRRLPGEGAVVLRLKRYRDAVQHQDPILGIIEAIQPTVADCLTTLSSSLSPVAPALAGLSPNSQTNRLVPKIGDLKAAQVLVSIAADLANSSPTGPRRCTYHSSTSDGPAYRVQVVSGPNLEPERSTDSPEPQRLGKEKPSSRATPSITTHARSEPSPHPWLADVDSAGLQVAVFPGQGSQSPTMFDRVLATSPDARRLLAEAEAVLASLGSSSARQLCRTASKTENPTDGIWAIQGSMLIADVLYAAAALERGLAPDLLIGHSLGELAAMVVAGVWSFPQAIRFVYARASAVARHAPLDSGLLSVQAAVDEVEMALRGFAAPVRVTHDNSPRQTVVGGLRQYLKDFQQLAKTHGWSNVLLNVPVAFHTPLMTSVQHALFEEVQRIPLRPARLPVLSTVSGRLVVAPEEFRRNLLEQLSQPVLYQSCVRQAAAWGALTFTELGPGDVLTRFNRSIVGEEGYECLAFDQRAVSDRPLQAGASASQPLLPFTSLEVPLETSSPTRTMIDATAPRRQKLRAQAVEAKLPPKSECSSSVKPSPAVAATAADTYQLGDVEAFVRDFIVEHTGYPPDMIELDWDLEADLGIDSIKQAQLFGELRELFAIAPELLTSSNTRSIRQIITILEQSGSQPQRKEPRPSTPSAASPRPEPSRAASPGSVGHKPTGVAAVSAQEMTDFMIDFVVEHTGYPRDLIDLEADFEADLGLDSIKLAQLFGELRNHFALPGETNRAWLAQCRKLADILALFTSPETVHPKGTSAIEAPRLPAPNPPAGSSYENGFSWGRKHAGQAQAHLVDRLCRHPSTDKLPMIGQPSRSFDHRWWQGVADGLEIDEACVLNAVDVLEALMVEVDAVPSLSPPANDTADSAIDHRPAAVPLPSEDSITRRYELTMVESPIPRPRPMEPSLYRGAALILGRNSLSAALQASMQAAGVRCRVLDPHLSLVDLKQALAEAWSVEPVLHLFLTMPHDSDAAIPLTSAAWRNRRDPGMTRMFWFCQDWLQRIIESGSIQQATLFGFTRLGGDFGLHGPVIAPESGAMTGLLKAMVIENWVNGHRGLAVKVIDAAATDTAEEIVEAFNAEFANTSYDMEISWTGGIRRVVRAQPREVVSLRPSPVTRGASWICTGGARGITAFVAEHLGQRYDLTLHLIGMAPAPNIPESWQNLDEAGRRELKLSVMQQARAQGPSSAINPLKAWQNVEKAIEISTTLRRLRQAGLRVFYHSCDCADAAQLRETLQTIRSLSGPIRGCLHGAGVGQDARFDRKLPEKVDQCLAAKIDGAINLMEATQQDPLEYFIGFGSISGRFGANGHTDYSMANDGLAKFISWYRHQRPEVKAVCFHWHAWGDIGMATKPETKLALEMIQMQFMPATEGLAHLLREIEGGAPQSEVLITDDRYYRMFYPAETVESERNAISPDIVALLEAASDRCRLDPRQDIFLKEHRFHDRPLLPMVIGLELMVEAVARQHGWLPMQFGGPSLCIRSLESLRGLRFFSDELQAVDIAVIGKSDKTYRAELRADFVARNGQLMEAQRAYLRAEISKEASPFPDPWQPRDISSLHWSGVKYPPSDAIFYVGPAFRVLKRVAVEGDRGWGMIQAPSLIELAGNHRQVIGWRTPSAVLDASLYTTGVLAWHHVRPGVHLPISIEELRIHRLPQPGESCLVETRCRAQDARHASFDFCVWGVDGKPLIEARGYRTAWLEPPDPSQA